MAITSAPRERNSAGPSRLAAPLAQSSTNFNPLRFAPGIARPRRYVQIFFVEREIGRDRNAVRRRLTALVLVNFGFEVLLDFIRKFHPRSGEQLDAIVMKWIVGSGNHHSRRIFILPNEASDAGSGDDARGKKRHAVIGEAGGKLRSDVRPGFARIHADQDARLRVGFEQIFAQRPRDPVKRGVVQRISAGNAANAVRAEQFFGHGIGKSRQKNQARDSIPAFVAQSRGGRIVQRKNHLHPAGRASQCTRGHSVICGARAVLS